MRKGSQLGLQSITISSFIYCYNFFWGPAGGTQRDCLYGLCVPGTMIKPQSVVEMRSGEDCYYTELPKTMCLHLENVLSWHHVTWYIQPPTSSESTHPHDRQREVEVAQIFAMLCDGIWYTWPHDRVSPDSHMTSWTSVRGLDVNAQQLVVNILGMLCGMMSLGRYVLLSWLSVDTHMTS